MQLRSVFCLTVILALAVAVPAQAAIMLELGPVTNLDGGLISRNVIAIATEGETIAGFDAVNLTNAHQVWGLGDAQTLRQGQDPAFGFDATWAAYDSRLLNPTTDYVGAVGAPLAETNDLSTTGMLGLPQAFGQDAPSGFGTINSADGTDGFRLLPQFQGANVPFLQVVTEPMTAILDVKIGFFPMGSTAGQTASVLGFEIGGDGGGEPPVVGDLDLTALVFDEIVSGPVPLSGGAVDTLVLDDDANPLYTPGFGADLGNPTLSFGHLPTLGLDGMFMWDTNGARRGTYVWGVTGTNGDGSDGGLVTVDVTQVPEPATFALCGLALVGLVGCTRRRG